MNSFKIFLTAVICFFLTGCAFLFNPYTTTLDDFKSSKKSTLELTSWPTEIQSPVLNANIIFERITYANDESVNIYFVISRSSSSFKMENKCYIMADGKRYELNIESEGPVYQTKLESSSSTVSVKDSTKVKTESNSKLNTYNWYEEKLVIRITPDIKISLLKSSELQFRFYFGPKQGTFSFKGKSLKRVKGLFEI